MKILVAPNSLDNVDDFKQAEGLIIGIKNFSYLISCEVEINELKDAVELIKKVNKKIFISLNRLMYNKDIPLIEEYLLVIEKLDIDGILYDDLSILSLSKKLSLKTPLVWFGIHSFTNQYTSDYWYKKGVSYGVLSTEITLDHITNICENTKLKTIMYGFGYLPMFVSGRKLLTSYFKYTKQDKKSNVYHMYEEMRKKDYPTYETNDGTVILSSDILSMVEELPKVSDSLDYLLLSSLNMDDNLFLNIYNCYVDAIDNLCDSDKLKNIRGNVSKLLNASTDRGFLYKETVYRVKE
jgi:putative protease